MTLKRWYWYLVVAAICFGLIVTLATPVFAGQPTQAEMPIEKVVIPAENAKNTAGSADSATLSCKVSGESNMLKINQSFGATVIYIQCGHIIAKVAPAGCGCSSGQFRYTTDCPKSDPIYINLPCMRHKP